jgi:hypothetical protein
MWRFNGRLNDPGPKLLKCNKSGEVVAARSRIRSSLVKAVRREAHRPLVALKSGSQWQGTSFTVSTANSVNSTVERLGQLPLIIFGPRAP